MAIRKKRVITSFAEFFDALDASLAYVESPDFYHPALQPGLRSELLAVRAWTARGRTPLVAERVSLSFVWALARARDGGPPEPPAHQARLDRAAAVIAFFAEWPRDDDDAKAEYERLGTMPRRPGPRALRAVLEHLEAALAQLPEAAVRPPASAFESAEPLMRDAMTTPQWAYWVLVPRLQGMIEGKDRPPSTSQLTKLVRGLADDEATWPLLYAIGELDDVFVVNSVDCPDDDSYVQDEDYDDFDEDDEDDDFDEDDEGDEGDEDGEGDEDDG